MMYSRAIIIQAVICAGDDAAIEAYQQFLSPAPSDYEFVAESYYHLGFYSFKKGDVPKAAASTYIVTGENILYHSHKIPEFDHLLPLFVDIWSPVHAPDV
jgi:TolA-binding protein